jgi:hypothetical protein
MKKTMAAAAEIEARRSFRRDPAPVFRKTADNAVSPVRASRCSAENLSASLRGSELPDL